VNDGAGTNGCDVLGEGKSGLFALGVPEIITLLFQRGPWSMMPLDNTCVGSDDPTHGLSSGSMDHGPRHFFMRKEIIVIINIIFIIIIIIIIIIINIPSHNKKINTTFVSNFENSFGRFWGP